MENFARVGNNLSADFINTVVSFDHEGGTIRSAGDVVDFLTATGALDTVDEKLARKRVRSPADAERLLASALALRAAVTDAFTAIEERRPLSVDALACINAILALDGGYERIEPAKTSGYTLAHVRANDDVSATLVPIARDIAGLLATPNAPVRHCAGAGCVRHFYDDSRTGRRRWCEMAICGNRAKAAAFTARRGPRSQERTPNR